MNLLINHRLGTSNVSYFNSFQLELRYDSVASSFGFNFYFDPNNAEHAELACVSHFHEAIVQDKGETLMTGFLLTQTFNLSAKKELCQFGGYSKAGVLEDCNIPPDLYPLQTDGLSLAEIARRLTSRFRLKIIIDPAVQSRMNQVIKKSTADATTTIKDYLTDLCTQRKIIMSHNEKGDLVFTEAKTDVKPLFTVDEGLIGTSMSMTFAGQGIHSHITVMKQASSDGGNAGEYTIRNPYCPVAYVYRPKTIIMNSGDDITIQEAAVNALSAELKNITLTINIDRWDLNGKLLRPNNTIKVKNKELFLYKETIWFIESIRYTGNEKENTAVLTCVLPEVYNGKIPKNVFVDPHDNLPRFDYKKR